MATRNVSGTAPRPKGLDGGRPLPSTDLSVLRAMVGYPQATDEELAKCLGLSRPTITRARIRLAKRGLWQARYTVDLDRAFPGPLVVVGGHLSREADEDAFAKNVLSTLKDQAISGGLLIEGGSFCGLVMPGSLERLQGWAADVYDLRVRPGGAHAVSTLERFPFIPGRNVRRTLADFGPVVELVAGKVRCSSPIAAPHSAKARPARSLRRNEFTVARELISHPERSVAEGTAAVALSRSTFAHVKSRLLSEGLLRREVWVDLPAFGFPYLLAVGYHRRPSPGEPAGALTERVSATRVPPISVFSAPLSEFTVTPFRDLSVARELVNRVRQGFDDPRLLSQPYVAVFDMERARTVAHSEPGDLTAAWFTPRK